MAVGCPRAGDKAAVASAAATAGAVFVGTGAVIGVGTAFIAANILVAVAVAVAAAVAAAAAAPADVDDAADDCRLACIAVVGCVPDVSGVVLVSLAPFATFGSTVTAAAGDVGTAADAASDDSLDDCIVVGAACLGSVVVADGVGAADAANAGSLVRESEALPLPTPVPALALALCGLVCSSSMSMSDGRRVRGCGCEANDSDVRDDDRTLPEAAVVVEAVGVAVDDGE